MAWIKRNLFFVMGGVFALGLLGWASYYNFSKWKLNDDMFKSLNDKYAEIKRLNGLHPHPGNKLVDNVAAARDQQQQMRDILGRETGCFARIPAIPPSTNVSSQEFAASLRQAIDQMNRDAYDASVVVPPRYNFTFEAQRQKVLFAAGSLESLSVQLGEVKAICDILNHAKINSINSIRRERTSDDASGPPGDYTTLSSETNDLAVLSPYEITIQCFSSELAAVLDGFAASPHGMIVKTLDVQSAAAAPAPAGGDAGNPTPAPTPAVPAGPAGSLTEKQLRVTMLIEVVKPLPGK